MTATSNNFTDTSTSTAPTNNTNVPTDSVDQQYVDKYEKEIKANIAKNRKYYRPHESKKIGGTDEE